MKNFPILVLRIITSGDAAVPEMLRQSAAILFKNMAKRYHAVILDEQDRTFIMQNIVNVMLQTRTTAAIQRQMSEAVALVAEHEFPERWPSLLPELTQKLTQAI